VLHEDPVLGPFTTLPAVRGEWRVSLGNGDPVTSCLLIAPVRRRADDQRLSSLRALRSKLMNRTGLLRAKLITTGARWGREVEIRR
jgi:hypothetical protein